MRTWKNDESRVGSSIGAATSSTDGGTVVLAPCSPVMIVDCAARPLAIRAGCPASYRVVWTSCDGALYPRRSCATFVFTSVALTSAFLSPCNAASALKVTTSAAPTDRTISSAIGSTSRGSRMASLQRWC
jgi:hypothetical protein